MRPYFTYRPIPTNPTWFYVQRVKLRSGQLEATVQSARHPLPGDFAPKARREPESRDVFGPPKKPQDSSPSGWAEVRRLTFGSFQLVLKEPSGYYGTSLGKSFSIFIHEVRIATPLLPWALLFSVWPIFWLIRFPSRRKKTRARRGLCVRCGYNLAGSTTGVCSECGTKYEPKPL